MPQIPGVPTLDPVDKPRMSPAQAGRAGAAIADMGAAAEGDALEGLQIQGRLREAQKSVDEVAFQNQAKALFDQYQVNLKKTQNSRDVPDLITKTHDDLNALTKEWSKSPAYMRLQQVADGLIPEVNLHGQLRAADLQSKEWNAQIEIQKQTLLPQLSIAIRNGDTEQASYIKGLISHQYDQAEKAGLISASDRQLDMDAQQIVVRKQINEAAIMSTNPAERKAAIKQLGGGTSTEAPSGPGYPAPDVTGNIQWYNRPEADTNSIKKGTTGTVLSASREQDGYEVLFPRIYDGKLHSEDEAWQHYKDTGQHMGKWRVDPNNPEAAYKAADAYGGKYHEDAQAGKFGSFQGKTSSSGPLDLTSLAPGDISALREHAMESDNTLTRLSEAQDLNAKLNIVHNAFQSPEFKNNFEGQQQALNDPQWLSQHGIVDESGKPDFVMAEKLSAESVRQEEYRKKEQADKDEKEVEKFSPAIDENKMSRAEIDALPNESQGGISNRARAQMIRQWTENFRINRQLATMDRQEARQAQEDLSSNLAANAYMDIASGKILDPVNIKTMPGMTQKDKAQVVSTIAAAKTDKEYQSAMSIIAGNFPLPAKPKGTPTDADLSAYSDKSMRQLGMYAETQEAFVKRVNDHPEEGKLVSAQIVLQPVVQKKIADHINQIFGAPPTQPDTGWFGPVKNFLIQHTIGSAFADSVQKSRESSPSTPADTPKEGTTKKNSNGATVVYRGGKWEYQ